MKHKGHEVRDYECRKRTCLTLGEYQHRGAVGAAGSRSAGRTSKCCLTRAYRGCPSDTCEAPPKEDHPNG